MLHSTNCRTDRLFSSRSSILFFTYCLREHFRGISRADFLSRFPLVDAKLPMLYGPLVGPSRSYSLLVLVLRLFLRWGKYRQGKFRRRFFSLKKQQNSYSFHFSEIIIFCTLLGTLPLVNLFDATGGNVYGNVFTIISSISSDAQIQYILLTLLYFFRGEIL